MRNKASRNKGLIVFWLFFIFTGFFPTSAMAHLDFKITSNLSESVKILPEGYKAYPLQVHYHRLVGQFEVAEPMQLVHVMLMDEDNYQRFQEGKGFIPFYDTAVSDKRKVNYLVRCCGEARPIAEPGWDRLKPEDFDFKLFYLVITNPSSKAQVTVNFKVSLIHDDAAVTVYGTETGHPREDVYGTIGGLVTFYVIAVILYHRLRAGTAADFNKPDRAFHWLAVANFIVFASLCLVSLSLGYAGMNRYGGNLLAGLVAGTDLLPIPQGPFGGSFPIVYIIFLLIWLFSLLLWVAAFTGAARAGSTFVGILGVMEGASSFFVGALAGITYDDLFIPVLLGLAVGAPQMLGGLYLWRRARTRKIYLLPTARG